MNIPTIPPIDKVSDMLNLLGSDNAYRKRMQDLATLQNMLSGEQKRWQEYKSADALKTQAQTLMGEAKSQKIEADKYKANAEKIATEIKSKAVKEADNILGQARLRKSEAEAQWTEGQRLLAAVDLKSKQVDEKYQQAVELMDAAKSAMINANEVRVNFEARKKRLEDAIHQ